MTRRIILFNNNIICVSIESFGCSSLLAESGSGPNSPAQDRRSGSSPDMLHFLWNLADRSAWHHVGFYPIAQGPDLMSESTDHDRDFRRLRGKLFNDYRLRLQTAIFEAVTMRVYGRSFALTCSANYRTRIRTLNWNGIHCFHWKFHWTRSYYHRCHKFRKTHDRLWKAEDVHAHPLLRRRMVRRGKPDGMLPMRRALWGVLPTWHRAWIGSCSIL